MMWFTVESGGESGKRVAVTGPRFIIGRDEGCDLVLRDEQVSRRHARVDVLDDGRVVLRNLASKNGTFVDGRGVDHSLVLRGGEAIQIGRTVLRSSRGDTATAVTPPKQAPTSDATHAAARVASRDERVAAVAASPKAAVARQSTLHRMVYAAIADEVKGIKHLTWKGMVVRGVGAAVGSATVGILWRILS
jgi:pSer/pThr/pTyr-binding forkhead associated (FHA) protein